MDPKVGVIRDGNGGAVASPFANRLFFKRKETSGWACLTKLRMVKSQSEES